MRRKVGNLHDLLPRRTADARRAVVGGAARGEELRHEAANRGDGAPRRLVGATAATAARAAAAGAAAATTTTTAALCAHVLEVLLLVAALGLGARQRHEVVFERRVARHEEARRREARLFERRAAAAAGGSRKVEVPVELFNLLGGDHRARGVGLAVPILVPPACSRKLRVERRLARLRQRVPRPGGPPAHAKLAPEVVGRQRVGTLVRLAKVKQVARKIEKGRARDEELVGKLVDWRGSGGGALDGWLLRRGAHRGRDGRSTPSRSSPRRVLKPCAVRRSAHAHAQHSRKLLGATCACAPKRWR